MSRTKSVAKIRPPATLERVYDFYDEPVLFTARDADKQLYLCMLVAIEGASQTWLYVPVSEGRLAEIEANRVDLRSAFAEPEGNQPLIIGATGEGNDSWRLIQAADLPDRLLNEAGVFLDL